MCLAAVSTQPDLSGEKTAVVFSVARLVLDDMQTEKGGLARGSRGGRGAQSGSGSKAIAIDVAARGFVEVEADCVALLGVFASLATQASSSSVPLDEWSALLKQIVLDLSSSSAPRCSQTIDVIEKVAAHVLGDGTETNDRSKALWMWYVVDPASGSLEPRTSVVLHQLPGSFTPENCPQPALNPRVHEEYQPRGLLNPNHIQENQRTGSF